MVDLFLYSGKWYEIYVQNAFFEMGCDAATAEYEMIPGGLSVLNKCYSKNGKGSIYTIQEPYYKEVMQIKGVAKPLNYEGFPMPLCPMTLDNTFVFNPYNNVGEYDLTFETGQKGIYKIFFTNYYFSIVGTLENNYLSILSRTPYVNREVLNYYLNLARSYGFKIKI